MSKPEDNGFDFLREEGELATLIRAHDWASTPLGPPSTWSPSLRNVVRFLLANRFPMLLWWGPEYIQIYNDHYVPILGTKHPEQAMGKPVRECWHEVFDILEPMVDRPFNGGASSWLDDMELIVMRHGFAEESHFTGSYSPVPDDTAPRGIGGVLATVFETTEKVIGERRVTILSKLGAHVAEAKTDEQACSQAIAILSQYPKDVPFALLYLVDDSTRKVQLVSSCGIDAAIAGPTSFDLDGSMADVPWPIGPALATESMQFRTGLASFLPAVPPGPWANPPDTVAVVPVKSNVAGHPAGALVVGISACIRLDDRYRSFLELVGSQVSTAVANARAYEEERRRAEALAELDRAKTTFFSNVSHEFRTPLTLMLGPIEDAFASAQAPAVRANLDTAHRNAQRLLKLVNSLLDFARIEAGRLQASYAPTDICALTVDLASTFRSAMQKAGLEFDVECDSFDEPVYVDREMWEKIVLNLLSNAFKFTLKGKVSVHIYKRGDHAILDVIDTGVGVPAKELPRLFDRFHRVEHTEARTHEGTGIGLAMVQELVRMHGGEIEVDSTPGVGTRFTVRIPFGIAHLPPDRVEAAPTMTSTAVGAHTFVQEALRWLPDSEGPAVTPAGDDVPRDQRFKSTFGARIVLADDNSDMRAYLRELLGRFYVVETAADGLEALEAVRRRPPDMVIADVMMPRLDGFQLLKALRNQAEFTDIPVVLVSARAGEEARIEGLGAGADDYVVKPFHARELLTRVGALLELAATRKANEGRRRTLLEDNAAVMEALNNVGAMVASDLDRDKVVQAVTDAATEVTTAAFGAFFYNVKDDAGESYLLYTISGVPREAFSKFPMPRNTAVFAPTFEGTAVVRSGDITKDSRFGHNPPHYGMPRGHLPVRSYLAVPVRGRGAEVLGGLFFGHPEVDRFTEHHERLAVGISAWASVALENSRMFTMVQESSRLKDEFLASLSHELRTPLNAVLGYARMLRAGIVPDERQAKAIETIERNATSLAQIVEDVLDVSRIVSGKIRLNVQSVDFPQVVQNAVDAVRPAADAKGVRIETVVDPRATPVSGDPERLQQVLWNLLSNAVKFTTKGGKVQVRLRRVASQVEISVADTGIGIAAEFLPHVFERFRQADAGITRERGGLGLGLSIARQLVELHGGTIAAASDGAGKGSTFTVTLPLMAVQQAAESSTKPRARIEAPPQMVTPGDLQNIHVLAVDDDPDAVRLIAELLSAAGAQVSTASSAQSALDVLATQLPHVVVTDLGMPHVDGFQLLAQIRAHSNPLVRKVPAAALTAFARSEDRVKALRAGFNIHLAKPIEPAELVATVAALARAQGVEH